MAKRQGHPLDMWDEIVANGAAGRFPTGLDVFRHKFFGLFYAAPAQDSFMCRLRMPNGSLDAHQLRGIADIAEQYGGGYADVTTRANLQIREIAAGDAVAVLMALQDLGLTSRGSGADNIRNITGSPTAGIDPQELIDTRPLARLLHHHILNHRELYGLPRKFNIAFDGGGRVGVLEDTNDIGFAAVAAAAIGTHSSGAGIPPGVYFRMLLGGVTGHGDFAADAGVMLAPEECVPMAAAVLRVFIADGDRTDRKRARLKYLLADWGLERFMAAVAKEIPFNPLVAPLSAGKPRGPVLKHGHIGVHRQKQPGLWYIGVVLPVGRLAAAQLRGLADAARELGSGAVRLTVWQNLILCDIPDARLAEAEARIAALGLATTASGIRGGLVACTGSTGCKFAATDTKGQALAIAQYLESRVPLDQPINIHLTGCPNSCAQHYVGDIGLLGSRGRRRHGRGLYDLRRRRCRKRAGARARNLAGRADGRGADAARAPAPRLSGTAPRYGRILSPIHQALHRRRAAALLRLRAEPDVASGTRPSRERARLPPASAPGSTAGSPPISGRRSSPARVQRRRPPRPSRSRIFPGTT